MQDSFLKKTPVKLRHSLAPAGAKSAATDELDDIYKKDDPIGSSLDTRKKTGGHVTNTVADKNSKAGKFFFTLRLKGPACEITEEQRRNTLRAQPARNAFNRVITTGRESVKAPPDIIEVSLKSRVT
jgi:hypothetical protein